MARQQRLNAILERAFLEPLITREEEEELCQRWQRDQEQGARRELARRTTRFVVRTARQFERYHIALDDLISEGMLGVLRAMDLFNPDYGVRFMTYADYWVRAGMLARIMKDRTVTSSSQGALKSRYFFRLRRELAKARALLGDTPEAMAAAAEALGLSGARVEAIERDLDASDLSLNGPTLQSVRSFEEELFDERNECSEFEHAEALRRLLPCLDDALAVLSARQVTIVRKRYLQDDAVTLSELAAEFGVSRERIRQLEAAALTKLRQFVLQNSPSARDELASAA